MKHIIVAFILGVVLTLSMTGIPNIVMLWKSIEYQEILSQVADRWFIEGYNSGRQNSLSGQYGQPNTISANISY